MTTKSKSQEKNKLSDVDENILKLFDIKKRLGKGAYGIVWKAMDKRTNETLAVKKIFDAFRDETDAQRTFREICFLQSFRSHPNVVKMLNVYKASNNLDIYLVFEYMESDLHNIIKKGSILKDIHKRYVMYQLVNAIRYIHSGNVIHRDLKPSNVLIDSKCRCKLADFGLARSLSHQPARSGNDSTTELNMLPLLTDYVATRWYRAPEILVASKRYTKGIDMWSLGCILAEMIRGKPLFQGTSTINQIEKIISALPDITDHDINAVGASFGSVLFSKQASSEKKTSLEELIPDASPDALNMVKSLLVLDPLARLTADQAINHSYVERFRHSVSELELNKDVLPPFRDDVRLSVAEYRTKLYEIAQKTAEKSQSTTNHSHSNNHSVNNHHGNSHHKRYPNTVKRIVPTAQPTKPREMKYLERNVHENPEIYKKVSKLSLSSNGVNGVSSSCTIDDSAQHCINSTQPRRTTKHTIVSPTLKQKLLEANKTPNRNRIINDQRHISTNGTQHQNAIEKRQQQQIQQLQHQQANYIHRSKTPIRHEQQYIHMEKRHSIDGGYGSLPADAGSSQKTPPMSHVNNVKVYKSSSITKLNNLEHTTAPPDKVKPPTPSTINPDKYRTLQRSSSVIVSKAQRYAHDSVMEALKPAMTSYKKSNEGGNFCYDARIKKIEADIAGFKDDIKKFAKENKYISRPATPTRSTPAMQSQPQQQQQQLRYPQVRSKYTGGLTQTISASKISTSIQHIVPAEGTIISSNMSAKRSALAFPSIPREKTNDMSIYSNNNGGSGDHIARVYHTPLDAMKSSDLYKYNSKQRHQQPRNRVSSKVI